MAKLCERFKERGVFVELFQDKGLVNMTVMDFSREAETYYAGEEKGLEKGIENSIKVAVQFGLLSSKL